MYIPPSKRKLSSGFALPASSGGSGGVATFATSSLSVAGHSITAVYGSDTNFNGSTSAVLMQNVTYNICVLYDQTMPKKLGSTIPIKLQLCDVNGVNTSSSLITVHATQVLLFGGSSPLPPEDAGNANPDDNFRFDSGFGGTGGYIFNLQTKTYSVGTWKLFFTATGDPITHTVQFGLK